MVVLIGMVLKENGNGHTDHSRLSKLTLSIIIRSIHHIIVQIIFFIETQSDQYISKKAFSALDCGTSFLKAITVFNVPSSLWIGKVTNFLFS